MDGFLPCYWISDKVCFGCVNCTESVCLLAVVRRQHLFCRHIIRAQYTMVALYCHIDFEVDPSDFLLGFRSIICNLLLLLTWFRTDTLWRCQNLSRSCIKVFHFLVLVVVLILILCHFAPKSPLNFFDINPNRIINTMTLFSDFPIV